MVIVILGLSITSSWGNGHATTYRALVRELASRGHRVLFLERDVPWYAENRDMPRPTFCRVALYETMGELRSRYATAIREADVVIVGSYVPEGATIGEWVTRTAKGVTAFYDIDTPVTLARLECGRNDYLTRTLVARYDLYLSFTGGPTLERLERELGSPCARPLYCSVDPELYRPLRTSAKWDLGYMGTYSADRQRVLQRLLTAPARRWKEGRFVVAGPQYPKRIAWPQNVARVEHLSPRKHRAFYNEQRFTLNVTRADMVAAGWSPSIRLFEAAACGTPIISDRWDGLDELFQVDSEILTAASPADVLMYLNDLSETERRAIGARGRARVLGEHTAAHRAAELERYVRSVASGAVPA
ncbi:MAG TPA: glycosyltransferase [Gemmatimonadaceae bacterium]|jgi:spore maturation protein CgeB|nr:glycosyltransferase [Gemmatimonadaceae bacterium]